MPYHMITNKSFTKCALLKDDKHATGLLSMYLACTRVGKDVTLQGRLQTFHEHVRGLRRKTDHNWALHGREVG